MAHNASIEMAMVLRLPDQEVERLSYRECAHRQSTSSEVASYGRKTTFTSSKQRIIGIASRSPAASAAWAARRRLEQSLHRACSRRSRARPSLGLWARGSPRCRGVECGLPRLGSESLSGAARLATAPTRRSLSVPCLSPCRISIIYIDFAFSENALRSTKIAKSPGGNMLHHLNCRAFARAGAAFVAVASLLIGPAPAPAPSGAPIKIGYRVALSRGRAPKGQSALLGRRIW